MVQTVRWVGSLALCVLVSCTIAGMLNLLVLAIAAAELRLLFVVAVRSLQQPRIDGRDRRTRYMGFLLEPVAG